MLRIFRLTNEPGGLGLSCSTAGLSLAGVPLLRRTKVGFVPRPASEIASLIKASFGSEGDPIRLQRSLEVIARALTQGDFARATMAAALTQTAELSWEAAVRLANAEEKLAKYDPDQPRDWHGRWTTNDATAPASLAVAADESAALETVDVRGPQFSNTEQGAGRNAPLIPASFAVPNDAANGDDARDRNALYQAFEREYDELGPVDFAKRVIEFGSWLEREGRDLSPAERERALAEYSFLQNRLSLWLGYDYKPPAAHLNLISAALTLYQGAVRGELIRPGDLPPSMLDVAGAAWASDNVPPRLPRPPTKPPLEGEPVAPIAPPKEIEGLGGIVDNSEVGIKWGRGIKEQGGGWEAYVSENNPEARALRGASKAFDQFSNTTGEAISDKTLNTLSVSYIKNPQRIYGKLRDYVNAAADYEPRGDFDIDPTKIQSRTIQLAIPQYTSPTQWQYIMAAIRYGRERGVSVIITRIRE